MADAIIHFTGDFSADQIVTTFSDLKRALPPKVLEIIECEWKLALARIGPRLYDGPMIRLNSRRIENGRLLLDLGRTSYKPFMGTNLTHPELADEFGVEVLANPLGLSAALESADGFLLFGRRNPDMAFYPNRIHPFAGTAESADVFADMRKELEEEVGLRESDIAEIRCLGMAEDPAIRQPELIFKVKSRLASSEIERGLDRKEHTEIVSIRRRSEKLDLDLESSQLTPIGMVTLSLWAKTPKRTR